jgi:protein-tyrosine phosphatase
MAGDAFVPKMPAFVDIHCHLIPGIDDGATTWDESLAMAQMAVADGIGTIIATPHQLGSFAHNQADNIRARTGQLQEFLDQNRVELRVLPGADVRIEPDLAARIRRGEVLSLADRRRHLLLELPHEIYFPIDRLLADLAAIGVVGILSHPERNSGILAQPSVVRPLVVAGCLMQITAGSLCGEFGPGCQQLSEWLVERRLVHFVSSDAHGVRSRRPLLRKAFDRIVELADRETALDLCCINPAAVAAGQQVVASYPPARASRLGSWLGRKKAG